MSELVPLSHCVTTFQGFDAVGIAWQRRNCVGNTYPHPHPYIQYTKSGGFQEINLVAIKDRIRRLDRSFFFHILRIRVYCFTTSTTATTAATELA